jgi:ribosomal protein L37AE/L43A
MPKQKKPPKNRQPKRKIKPAKCVNCDRRNATLQLNDKEWICEDCAQSISSHASEMGY